MSISQKIPLATSLSKLLESTELINSESAGYILPCYVIAVEGNIVTVNFDVLPTPTTVFPPVTMSIAQSKYVQLPVQIGDVGLAVSASVRLGGVNGLGTLSPAPFVAPSNLGAMVFLPISSALWTPKLDPLSLLLQGLNGVTIQDMEGLTKAILTPEGLLVNAQTSITFQVGVNTITINATGIEIVGDLSVTGTITNNSVDVGSTHSHNVVGVQGGSSTISTTVPN